MARLPSAADLGALPSGNSRRPIASYDASPIAKAGEHMGEAIAQGGAALAKGFNAVGEGLQSVAKGIDHYRRAQDDLDLERAKADKQVRLAQLDREFENDQDYATLEKRYTEGVAKINQDIEAQLGNPTQQERFRIWNGPRDEYGSGQYRAKARKIEGDFKVADATEKLEGLRQSGLTNPDPLKRAEAIDTGSRLIGGLQDAGFLDAAKATAWRKRWATDYAGATFEIMPAPQRVQALSDTKNPTSLVHFLPEDARVQMLEKAKREVQADKVRSESIGALNRFETKGLINDDITALSATGQGGNEAEIGQRIMRDYGQQTLREWQVARLDAGAIWSGSHDLYALSDAEIDKRLLDLTPKAGDKDFARKQAVYDAVAKRADNVRKLRNDDPARSVADDPAVKQAAQGVDPKDPASMKPLIAARLAAQERAGLPEDMRSPITRSEAIAMTVPLRRMLPGQEREVLTALGEDFKQRFGENADSAFQFALRAHKIDAETAKAATRVMKKLGLGQPLDTADERSIAGATELDAAKRAIGPAVPGAEFGIPGGPRSGDSYAAVETATPKPAEKKPLPPQADIKALIANPKLSERFDAKWGKGSAKKLLDTYTVR